MLHSKGREDCLGARTLWATFRTTPSSWGMRATQAKKDPPMAQISREWDFGHPGC